MNMILGKNNSNTMQFKNRHVYDCSNSLSMSMSSTSSQSNESKTNLIVNYLPQTMSSDDLKTIFQSIGPIESYKLIRDKPSQQSLCFGFVNYVNIEDAEKAIKSLNGLKIENKIIKVSYARPSCESIKGANLYVSGLPRNWTQDDMNNYFSQCGRVITSRILMNPQDGQSKGVGFIRFDQRNEAYLAINKLNGSLPENGAQELITVKFANYPLEIKNKSSNECFNNVLADKYRGGVGGNSNSQLFSAQAMFNPSYSLFYNTNELVCNSSENMLTQTTQQQQSQQNMQPIIQQQQQQQPIGLNIASNSSIGMHQLGWCLFVYNLYAEVEDSVIWQLFGPFGAVQSVKIIRDFHTQKCKGFAFVTMSSYENALNAVTSLNGIVLSNRLLQVSFKTNFIN